MKRRTFAAGAAALLLSPMARATSSPDAAVRLIVMNAPGTGTDTLARQLATSMGRQWQVPVLVENKVGAGGTIGTDFVAKSPPDGKTVLITNASHYAFPWLYDKLPYDAFTDFSAVACVATSTLLLMVRADSPFRSVHDIIAEAKKRPGKLSFSSGGSGTPSHLAGALLCSMAGIDIAHTPYKMASQSLVDLASGQLDMGILGISPSLPLLKAGKLRVVAITSAKRTALLPAVPTIAEAGLRGYDVASPIFALVRAGTPAQTVSTLASGVMRAAASAEFKALCAGQGLDAEIEGTAALEAAMPREFAKWKHLVAVAGAKAD
ncbi:tripartite tricarboxylate transporter substrate-binding protein [Cupriavidus numazuensis]|uniref:Tripartite tricarboxylate transporter substrate binding protein n=1 Tax=Cupriavidus numazuensis TaxID=221992 RepID=A0ABM8TGJ3_9BURK|nr:tripartite tricarboxylate transporter substrate-binding protein [Cupriavidus numazuensis]CAG2145039.1 hypothetical protein LMG26411_02670 [Cupriavidus numazuensis]